MHILNQYLLACVPLSEKACRVAGEKLNLTLSKGLYTVKGCYAYNDGRNEGGVYYGMVHKAPGWQETDQIRHNITTVYGYLYRPLGYDCKSGKVK